MKLTLSGVLIVSFLAMAAFGTMAMGHGQMHNRAICIASAIQAIYCPDNFTSAAYFGFHLNAFSTFFTAVFGGGLDGVLASFAAILSLAGFVLLFKHQHDFYSLVFKQKQNVLAEFFVYPFNRQITRWHALHENSPTISAASFRPSAIR